MDTLRSLLLVALGGALGSVARYLVSRVLTGSFPWATLTVNLVGSLAIGLLAGLISKHTLPVELRLLLVTGFCGGFTTFSTFASESLTMLKAGDTLLTAAYVAVSVFAGILAVYCGLLLSR